MINFEAHLLFYFDLAAEEGDLSTEQCPAVTWELQRDWILVLPALILVIKPFAAGFLSCVEILGVDVLTAVSHLCLAPQPGIRQGGKEAAPARGDQRGEINK